MPRIISKNVVLVWKKMSHDILRSFSLARVSTEVQFADQEETNWPNPFRTLMIIVTSSVVIVVIITSVMNVRGIKSFNSHRTFFHEYLFYDLEALTSLFRVKKLRSNSHSDADVWSELIISKTVRGFVSVLVHTSSFDETRFEVVALSLLLLRHVETPIKVGFNLVRPGLESYLFDSFMREFSLSIHFCKE